MFCFFLLFFLRIYSVPIFKGFPEETLIKISDVLDEISYQPGDYIVSVLSDLLTFDNYYYRFEI